MFVYMAMIDTPDDQQKFERIYNQYRFLMLYVAEKILQHREDAEAVGAIVDRVDTAHSVLTLVEESNTGKLKLIHFRANPIFQSRYQAAEVITVNAGKKQNFGFADFFQKFVVTVENRTMTVSGTQSRF